MLCRRFYKQVQIEKRAVTLTLTEGPIPSESSVTGTVESSNQIRTCGTLLTIVCHFITLIHVCNSAATRYFTNIEICFSMQQDSLQLYAVANAMQKAL